MKRKLIIISSFLSVMLMAQAQTIVSGVTVDNVNMERNGKYLAVDMNVDLSQLKVESNRAVLLTPRVVNGTDTVALPSVGVYGRTRYYHYVRNGVSMLTGETETSYRASQKPQQMDYQALIPYGEWMNGAELLLYRDDYGCCSTLLDKEFGSLGRHKEKFFPELVYVTPDAEIEKMRDLKGSAFIDFPVDQTIIYPEYRNNTVELGKIQATIDSLRLDKDVTVKSVWLKGFASPESPYSHNTDLAIGRTAALKKYIQQLYKFDDSAITTDYEPENWEGLRAYVVASNIDHKDEILALIDSDMKPDPKEWKIKSTYPAEYRFLLQNCYPALRRTDYRIEYTIRTFSEVDEIKRILQESPQKLSQNEFYLLAKELEPGTNEFTEVFETAVRMYPNDEVANLNAANAAMRRNDMSGAKRYLDKAGDSPQAVYAKGAYAYLTGDYANAMTLFQDAKKMGVKEAEVTLQQFEKKKK